MARDEQMIAALKRERAGYVARGETDRVAEVDEQLKKHGYEQTQDADPNAATPYAPPAPGGPKGRTASAGRQTASRAEGKGDDKSSGKS
ncbi:hypothetical protein Ssi03_76210 [Sphaerisporangium siamense]|uniref:Uncharacterized protein n=1 Tax=Sphaerisporangium siamense TaxID=795645 RepID=A0A7W7D385_9ACTN|nr:hypothetical protein [Sphaerisporangium siamense]MBB4699301.1 hypothetical protein [Sphaerisporangium siamense]GII89631.1 hypothetical protein Ssi03_76210 [Sphaerisporangium siamense]